MAEIYHKFKIQALYKYSDAEMEGTDGQKLCSILEFVGALNPQLNSVDALKDIQRREEIANAIENTLIPSENAAEVGIKFMQCH